MHFWNTPRSLAVMILIHEGNIPNFELTKNTHPMSHPWAFWRHTLYDHVTKVLNYKKAGLVFFESELLTHRGLIIWHHRTGSTLAQAMACWLMAPSHYLSQLLLWGYRHISQGPMSQNLYAINAVDTNKIMHSCCFIVCASSWFALINLTHIFQVNITGTGAIIWLSQCQ